MSERFLAGRRAWITGGVTGMGRAVALALAGAGADVAFGRLREGGELPGAAHAARRSRDEIKAAAEAIRAWGVDSFAAGLDVRSDASIDEFHAKATAVLGPFDILVNAAGVSAQET